MPTIALPTPYQLNTIAAISSDFVLKSEDAVAMVRRWYGDGTEEVGWKGKGMPQHTRWVHSTAYTLQNN